MFNFNSLKIGTGIISKEREIIVNVDDVMAILKAINIHLGYLDGQVGALELGDDKSKWFVSFNANDKEYGAIIKELERKGEFKLKPNSDDELKVVFERA